MTDDDELANNLIAFANELDDRIEQRLRNMSHTLVTFARSSDMVEIGNMIVTRDAMRREAERYGNLD